MFLLDQSTKEQSRKCTCRPLGLLGSWVIFSFPACRLVLNLRASDTPASLIPEDASVDRSLYYNLRDLLAG